MVTLGGRSCRYLLGLLIRLSLRVGSVTRQDHVDKAEKAKNDAAKAAERKALKDIISKWDHSLASMCACV